MKQTITGSLVRHLRLARGMTQANLAERLHVSDKAVSRWETGRGCPDMALLEPLAAALGVSVIELLSGERVVNANRSSNLLRSRFHVCPVCGNVVLTTGDALVSCCGNVLTALKEREADGAHEPQIEKSDGEYYVSVPHAMEKDHYLSFLAAVRPDGWEIKKLYPEGGAEARFRIAGTRRIYVYCSRDGLFAVRVPKKGDGA